MLTPENIFEKEFKRSIRGYDSDEVNEFLDLVIQDYSKLMDENKQLKKEIQALRSSTNRQSFHSSSSEKDSILELVKRIEVLEKKTKFL